jgi:G3E family GTPase
VSLIDAKEFAKKLESTATKDPEAVDMLGKVSTADSDFPENELLLRQLVFADRVIINKTDLLPPSGEERDSAIKFIRDAIERVNT